MTPSLPLQPDASAFSPFPVDPEPGRARRAMEVLHTWAGDAAAVEGCVGDPPAGSRNAAHCLLTAAFVLLSDVPVLRPVSVIGAIVVGASAASRALGHEGLRFLVVRRPSWNLRVGAPGPGTRYVVAAAADRAPPGGDTRRVVLALVLAGLCVLTFGWGGPSVVGSVCALVLVCAAAWMAWRGRSELPAADLPEARAVAAALRSVGRARALGRVDVVGVVAAAGAHRATGVAGFLDWWAVDPAHAVVVWVDAAGGAERRAGPVDRLRRDGWDVTVVRVDPTDAEGAAIDREWLLG